MKTKNPISKENKKIITGAAFSGINELEHIYSNIDKLSIRDAFFIFHNENTNETLKDKNINIDFNHFFYNPVLIILYNFNDKPHNRLMSYSIGDRFSTDLVHEKQNNITVINTDTYSFMNLENFKTNNFGFVAKGIDLTPQFTSVVDSLISTTASRLSYKIEKDFPLIKRNETNPLGFSLFFKSLEQELIDSKKDILELKHNFHEKIDLWNLNNDSNIQNLIPLNQKNDINILRKKHKL